MYVWVRLIRVGLAGLFKKRLGLLDESVVSFVVAPPDLDGYLHMNNGRYLTVMDLGRADLMLRNGMVRVSLRHRWQPLVASTAFRYRRVLPPFARFRLRTRLLCWEDEWLYVGAVFERGGEKVAEGLVKMVVMGHGGRKVPFVEMARAAGHPGESPPLGPEVKAWRAWERTVSPGRDGEGNGEADGTDGAVHSGHP